MKLLAENAPKVVEKMQEIEQKEQKELKNQNKTPVKKGDDDKYTLDHTIVVYLMGP